MYIFHRLQFLSTSRSHKNKQTKMDDMGHDFLLFYIFLRFVSSTQKTCCFCLQGTIHKPLMYMSEA